MGLQALGDGLADAAVALRYEMAEPEERRNPDRIARMKATIHYRALIHSVSFAVLSAVSAQAFAQTPSLAASTAGDAARTKAFWGDEVTSVFDGSSSSAPVVGVTGGAARGECPATEFAGIALEYGTLPIEDVLQALRAEHWLVNHPDAPREQRESIKREFRDAFYIDENDWKETVYTQALAACLHAVEHLTGARAHAEPLSIRGGSQR